MRAGRDRGACRCARACLEALFRSAASSRGAPVVTPPDASILGVPLGSQSTRIGTFRGDIQARSKRHAIFDKLNKIKFLHRSFNDAPQQYVKPGDTGHQLDKAASCVGPPAARDAQWAPRLG